MVAWVICGCIGGAWLHGKEKARHLMKMNQAQQHHESLTQQITELDQHIRELVQLLSGSGKENAL